MVASVRNEFIREAWIFTDRFIKGISDPLLLTAYRPDINEVVERQDRSIMNNIKLMLVQSGQKFFPHSEFLRDAESSCLMRLLDPKVGYFLPEALVPYMHASLIREDFTLQARALSLPNLACVIEKAIALRPQDGAWHVTPLSGVVNG